LPLPEALLDDRDVAALHRAYQVLANGRDHRLCGRDAAWSHRWWLTQQAAPAALQRNAPEVARDSIRHKGSISAVGAYPVRAVRMVGIDEHRLGRCLLEDGQSVCVKDRL
jgi:hypothetical protein